MNMQITSREFREELRNNPVLATAVPPSTGHHSSVEDAGMHALRNFHHPQNASDLSIERTRDSNKPRPFNEFEHSDKLRRDSRGRGRGEPRNGCHDSIAYDVEGCQSTPEISWREFVSIFLPLGGEPRVPTEGRMARTPRKVGNSPTGKTKKTPTSSLPQAGTEQPNDKEYLSLGLEDGQEFEMLWVAFAMVASTGDTQAGHSSGRTIDDLGSVSLLELRVASAELDGEEPPEGPVRIALTVRRKHGAHLRRRHDARYVERKGGLK